MPLFIVKKFSSIIDGMQKQRVCAEATWSVTRNDPLVLTQ